jgi:hypothetical protein
VTTRYVEPWIVRAALVVASIGILFWLATLVVMYVGDEYVSPSWDERSVPAPTTY